MSLILREKQFIKDNFIDKINKKELIELGSKPTSTLSLISRYYCHCEHKEPEEITKELNEVMKKNYPGYNEVLWINTLEYLSKKAIKYEVTNLQGIPITKKELDVIESIKDERMEKYLFVMLCYAKAYYLLNEKTDGWINTDLSIIYKGARIRSKKSDDRFHLVHELLKLHYINDLGNTAYIVSVSNKNTNTNVKVNFIDMNSECELYITDLRELGYEYLLYKGQNFTRCKKCNILIKDNKAHTKKYCNKCKEYHTIDVKAIKCVDCGKEFEVDANSRKKRCDECYKKERSKSASKSRKKRMLTSSF